MIIQFSSPKKIVIICRITKFSTSPEMNRKGVCFRYLYLRIFYGGFLESVIVVLIRAAIIAGIVF